MALETEALCLATHLTQKNTHEARQYIRSQSQTKLLDLADVLGRKGHVQAMVVLFLDRVFREHSGVSDDQAISLIRFWEEKFNDPRVHQWFG